MTDKQKTTLVLFAQNYSMLVIAKKQRVSLSSIRQRITSLSKNHSREFNNALALRDIYKKSRDAIKSPIVFSNSLLNTLEIQEIF